MHMFIDLPIQASSTNACIHVYMYICRYIEIYIYMYIISAGTSFGVKGFRIHMLREHRITRSAPKNQGRGEGRSGSLLPLLSVIMSLAVGHVEEVGGLPVGFEGMTACFLWLMTAIQSVYRRLRTLDALWHYSSLITMSSWGEI